MTLGKNVLRRIISIMLMIVVLLGVIPITATEVEAASAPKNSYTMPVKGVTTKNINSVLTATWKDDEWHKPRGHYGIDLGWKYGSTIIAACDGEVYFAGWNYTDHSKGYGLCVRLKHANGEFTLYGHMDSLSVKTGQKVTRGQVLGTMGNTGHSFGKHLHFGIYKSSNWSETGTYADVENKTWNPLTYLKDSPAPAQKTFTMRYGANGGSGTQMADQKVTYGVTTSLKKNTYTRSGHTFKGWYLYRQSDKKWWYTSADGSKKGWYVRDTQPSGYIRQIWYDGATFGGTCSEVNGDVIVLYAVWAPTSSRLIGYKNISGKNYIKGTDFISLGATEITSRDTGVSTVSIDSSTQYGGYNSLKITNTKAGSSGKDLRIATETNGNKFDDLFVGDNKKMVLSFYAKASNGGTNMYFRWGYENKYRNISLGTSWQKYSVPMDKMDDYGNCIHPYVDRAGTVWISQLQLEDGTSATSFVPEEGGSTYTNNPQGGKYTLPSAPSRPGYVFDGWYTKKEGGEKITPSTTVRSGHMVVYAHWTKTSYTVRYDANGGVGSMPNQRIEYGEKPLPKLTNNTFKREGYIFDNWFAYRTSDNKWWYSGWYEEGYQPSGYTKERWIDGQEISAIDSKVNGDVVVLQAQWKPVQYKVRYDGNGGAGSMADTSVTYGTTIYLRTNTFAKEGYTFNGWQVVGKDSILTDGARADKLSTTNNDVVTLKAIWKEETHNHKWDSEEVTKKATCEDSGIKKYTCTECGETRTESILAKGHSLTRTNAKMATCTASGTSEYWTCSSCNKVFGDSAGTSETTVAAMKIPALGHDYGNWTYINRNQHERVCEKNSSHVEKENHTWDSGHVTRDATETTSGVRTYTCTVCNGTKTESIAPIPHEHILVKTNAKQATCEASGTRAYWTCTSCGKVFSNSAGTNETTVASMKVLSYGHSYGDWEYINASQHERVCENDSSHVETQSHTWDSGKVTKEPTETASGVRTYTCIVCNGTKTESITPTPHEHTLVKTSAKSATCTSSGTRAYWTCSSCGKVFSDSAGTNETTVASMKVPSYGHSYGDWEYINASQHERVCDNDSTHIETGSHTWNSGRVTREATETQTGIRTYTCTVCGGTKTETIPKPAPTKKATIRRLYGDDRYATALKIADAYKGDTKQSKLDYIIVACGTNFPDALAASYLANKRNAPVIVWREKDNAKVQAYIKNNVKKGGMVYLLGGPTIVGKSIANGMKNYKFVRLYDADRYGTNIKILRKAGLRSGEILVCDGTNFQNALIASATGKPILLVKPNGLTRDQRSYLASLGSIRFTIIGNTSSVSEEVSKQLSVFGSVSRINGSTPDEVSANVARRYYSDPTEITLAIDNNFPDGLCGGPLAIAGMGPIFLVSDSSYAHTKTYFDVRNLASNLKRINVLGGPTLVSDATVRKIVG